MLTKVSKSGLASGPRTTRRMIPADPDLRPAPWSRPADWLALPAVVAGDQKVVGLYAVHNHASNHVAVIIAGACTIDWGDGSAPENFASGVQANHTFNYAGVGSGTLTTRGYRQAIVTITPQAGQNLTSVSFQAKNPATGATVTTQVAKWLDIKMAGASIAVLSVGAGNPNVIHLGVLERFEFVGPEVIANASTIFGFCRELSQMVVPPTFLGAACTSTNNMFFVCQQLVSAPMMDTHLVTNHSSMFSSCNRLTDVPLYDTSASLTTAFMFSGCSALKSVPKFNTSAVTAMNNMFASCSLLTAIPALDTSHVTTMANMFLSCVSLADAPQGLSFAACTTVSAMFSGCRSLLNVPAYNFPVCTNFASMFQDCNKLPVLPVFTFGAVPTACNNMVQNCFSLKSVPQWPTFHPSGSLGFMFNACTALVDAPMIDTAAVTTFSNMFNGCTSLRTVPLYNSPLVTSMTGMFAGCQSFAECPAFITANVTDLSNMFQGCNPLLVGPAFADTSKVTNFSTMFSGCISLEVVPAYNLTAATNLASMVLTCPSLSSFLPTNIKVSLSVASGRLAAAALDAIYNNLAVVAGQTITVSTNPGIAGDTPTIATGKGWTVTGS